MSFPKKFTAGVASILSGGEASPWAMSILVKISPQTEVFLGRVFMVETTLTESDGAPHVMICLTETPTGCPTGRVGTRGGGVQYFSRFNRSGSGQGMNLRARALFLGKGVLTDQVLAEFTSARDGPINGLVCYTCVLPISAFVERSRRTRREFGQVAMANPTQASLPQVPQVAPPVVAGAQVAQVAQVIASGGPVVPLNPQGVAFNALSKALNDLDESGLSLEYDGQPMDVTKISVTTSTRWLIRKG